MLSSKNGVWSEVPSTLEELIPTRNSGVCFSQVETFIAEILSFLAPK